MQNETYEAWNGLVAQAIENFKRIGETNLACGERLLREQVGLATALVEMTASGAKDIAASKDVKEMAARQASLAQECGKHVLETTRHCADIVADTGKAYQAVFESGVKAAQKAKKAA